MSETLYTYDDFTRILAEKKGPEVVDKFEVNLAKYRPDFFYWKLVKRHCFSAFVASAFLWSESEEGDEFWRQIAEELENVKQ